MEWTRDSRSTEIRFEVGADGIYSTGKRRIRGQQRPERNGRNRSRTGQIYRFRQVYRSEKVRESADGSTKFTYGNVRDRLLSRDGGKRERRAAGQMCPCDCTRRRGTVVFEQQPGKTYSLLYGQERAPAAQYDLGQRVDVTQQCGGGAWKAWAGGSKCSVGGSAAVDRDA